MEASSKSTFFGLPSELRNAIYELVVFHYETNGIISPLPRQPQEDYAPGKTIVLVDGQRFAIENHRPTHFGGDQAGPASQSQAGDHKARHKAMLRAFAQTSNARSNHFCKRHCLKQPKVSKVCRQMREEALAVFYGVHHFHLEMGNFESTTTQGLVKPGWSPMDWWRAIGDSNLRRIAHLSMVCHPSAHGTGEVHIMLEYLRGTGTVDVKRITPLSCEKRKDPSKPILRHPADVTRFQRYRYDKGTRDGEFETALVPYTEALRESGLHVAALEGIVAALEPCNAEYLRDYISLGDDMTVGVVQEGRGERALQWKPFQGM